VVAFWCFQYRPTRQGMFHDGSQSRSTTHCSRSIPAGPERPAHKQGRDNWRYQHPWPPSLKLVGHMAATAFVFTSFITLVWLTSWGFSFLHSVHPFPEDVYQLFEALKRALVLIDAALSSVVLLRGLWQFFLNVVRGES
jgi:hypothetical protein